MGVDKRRLIRHVIEKLRSDRDALADIANETRRAATHEEARPENDKDTRGLEQSYLARGQAKRVAELEEALTRLSVMPIAELDGDSGIVVSALVTLMIDEGEPRRFFLVPAGGGENVTIDGEQVSLVTPVSPVGRALLGKRAGDSFELVVAGKAREYEIEEVA